MNVKPTLKASPRLKRRKRAAVSSSYPATPLTMAGKWIAWSKAGRIVASGDTLSGVMELVASKKVRGASYERVPHLVRGH
jgi:hypothetical protein